MSWYSIMLIVLRADEARVTLLDTDGWKHSSLIWSSTHPFVSLQRFHLTWGQILRTGTVSWSLWRDSPDLLGWTSRLRSWHLWPRFQHILSPWICAQQSVQDIRLQGKGQYADLLSTAAAGIIHFAAPWSSLPIMNHKYQTCTCTYDPMSSCLRWNSCFSQWERAEKEASKTACCALLPLQT